MTSIDLTSATSVPTDPQPLGSATTLDDLRREIRTKTRKPLKTYSLAARPAWAVRLDPNVDHHRAQKWQDVADGDDLLFSALFVAGQTVAILRDGKQVDDESGTALKFDSPWMKEATGRGTPDGVVIAFFADDQDLLQTASALQKAAGYDRSPKAALEDAADPTQS